MPKFDVHLLTTARSWKGIEAVDAEHAEQRVLANEPLDWIHESDEQWRLVTEEVEEDEGEEEVLVEPGHTVRYEKGYEVHEVKIHELVHDGEEDETSTV